MSIWRKRSIFDWLREIDREMEHEADAVFRRIKEAEVLSGCMIPLYDVTETDSEIIVTIDMPGVEKEDINLKWEEGLLTLDAPCRAQLPSARGLQRRYRLTLGLPENVNSENATARYRNGVLEVRASKRAGGGKRLMIQ